MRVLALAVATAALAVGAAPADVNVSRLSGPQTEPAIAVDPSDPATLLAGSNSIREGTMRIYTSRDGGRTWHTGTTHEPPDDLLESCASDPAVAIDLRHRQYYAFGRAMPCGADEPQRIYVVTRTGPEASWSAPRLVAPLGRARVDDKPAIAVDTSPVSPFRGRVYLTWTHVLRNTSFIVVLAHSDDGGETWSRPVRVNRTGKELTYASVATARDGTVYVAWDDVGEFSLQIARSTNGGVHFGRQVRVASFVGITIPHCGSGIVIPALPRTCVHPNPIVSVDASPGRYSGRVYVSYARTEFRGNQAAHVAIFTPALERLYRDRETGEGRPVAPQPSGKHSDQFWPQSTVDRTTGTVWLCFYDTRGDPGRTRAHFACTASRNGGRTWLRPVRVASAASDATQPGAVGGYGYYQGLAAAGGVAHPIWTDSREVADLGEEIYTIAITQADLLGA